MELLPRRGALLLLWGSFWSCASQCQPKIVREMWGAYPKELDIGVYWYGHQDKQEKATGHRSKFFDPEKKTLIYFPGWAGGGKGWTVGCTRATSRCPGHLCPNQDLLADKWLNDGWNVGFFYWDQFADEPCTRDAEQKIWLNRGNGQMRWKSFDMETGKSTWYDLKDSPVALGDLDHRDAHITVAHVCVEFYKMAMREFNGPNVRFVGHSLGSQLAVKCGQMLHNLGHPAAPTRIAMLEPFFTAIHIGFLHCLKPDFSQEVGDRIPKAATSAVKDLWDTHGVAVEVYKSSPLTERYHLGPLAGLAFPDHMLENITVLVKYTADWCGQEGGEVSQEFVDFGDFGNIPCRHCAVFPTYFLNYNEAAPKLVGSKPLVDSCPVPSSSCADADIKELVLRQHLLEGQQWWKQVRGMDTPYVQDDAFTLMGPAYTSADFDLQSTTPHIAVAQQLRVGFGIVFFMMAAPFLYFLVKLRDRKSYESLDNDVLAGQKEHFRHSASGL